MADDKPLILTSREQEIFDMLLKGSTPKEIAYNKDLAYNTILSYQKSLYRKLGVHNINELLVKCRPLSHDTQPLKENIFGYKARFDTWATFNEESSAITFTETNEIINGKKEDCITISGYLFAGADNRYCGILGVYDKETLEVVKKMKSFSFKVLGGGNSFFVFLATAETNNGDHYFHAFRTVKDTEITVTVNVPEDLRRHGWSGEKAEFIQEKSTFLQFQPLTSGPFTLKIWDIRLYK